MFTLIALFILMLAATVYVVALMLYGIMFAIAGFVGIIIRVINERRHHA